VSTIWGIADFSIKEIYGLGLVFHTCNPRYLEGRSKRIKARRGRGGRGRERRREEGAGRGGERRGGEREEFLSQLVLKNPFSIKKLKQIQML
jgi:hypothetical protein